MYLKHKNEENDLLVGGLPSRLNFLRLLGSTKKKPKLKLVLEFSPKTSFRYVVTTNKSLE